MSQQQQQSSSSGNGRQAAAAARACGGKEWQHESAGQRERTTIPASAAVAHTAYGTAAARLASYSSNGVYAATLRKGREQRKCGGWLEYKLAACHHG